MEYKILKLKNNNKYDEIVNHTNQTQMFAEISGDFENYRYFVYREKVLLFRLEKFLIFTKAVTEYPEKNIEILKKFIQYCKKKRYIYSIITYENILDKQYEKPNPYTVVADTETFKPSKKRRYEIKKGYEAGIIIEKAEDDGLEIFAKMHEETVKRGESKANEKLSDRIKKYKKYYDRQLFCFFAKYEDEIISGVVIMVHKNQAYYFHNATKPEFYKYNPTTLILDYLIKWCAENEIKFLDMNVGYGVNKRKSGSKTYYIAKYKEKWGIKKEVYIYEPSWYLKFKESIYKLKEIIENNR